MSNTYELAIIGMGPAGIGVATALLGSGLLLKTICFERGSRIDDKDCVALNNNLCCETDFCHIISGIGGASNLSSGKMSFFPAGSGLVRFFNDEQDLKDIMMEIIETFRTQIGLSKVNIDTAAICDARDKYSANNINYKYYDVYEFDGAKYREYLSMALSTLIADGCQVYTNSEIVTITRDISTSLFSVTAKENGKTNCYSVRTVVFAGGSNEIDNCLFTNYTDTSKISYEIGVRIEAKSECYGNSLDEHGDLKLKYDSGRTYCVTKGGAIVSYKTKGYCLLEGYIDADKRTEYSNLAVLIKTEDKSDIEELLNNYRMISGGVPIRQKYTDYLAGRESSHSVYTTIAASHLGDINSLFSASINQAIKDFIAHVVVGVMGVKESELTIVAPEIKIARNIPLSNKFETEKNLYVVGAATGEFRGILQSLCSGIQCGKYILGG